MNSNEIITKYQQLKYNNYGKIFGSFLVFKSSQSRKSCQKDEF